MQNLSILFRLFHLFTIFLSKLRTSCRLESLSWVCVLVQFFSCFFGLTKKKVRNWTSNSLLWNREKPKRTLFFFLFAEKNRSFLRPPFSLVFVSWDCLHNVNRHKHSPTRRFFFPLFFSSSCSDQKIVLQLFFLRSRRFKKKKRRKHHLFVFPFFLFFSFVILVFREEKPQQHKRRRKKGGLILPFLFFSPSALFKTFFDVSLAVCPNTHREDHSDPRFFGFLFSFFDWGWRNKKSFLQKVFPRKIKGFLRFLFCSPFFQEHSKGICLRSRNERREKKQSVSSKDTRVFSFFSKCART